MKKFLSIIFLLLFSTNAIAALTVNNIPKVKTGGASPALQNSSLTESSGNLSTTGTFTSTPSSLPSNGAFNIYSDVEGSIPTDNIIGGLGGYCKNTGSNANTIGHCIGSWGMFEDTTSGNHFGIGSEGKIIGRSNNANSYYALIGYGMWQGAGTNLSTVYGQYSQTEITTDGTTPKYQGTVYGNYIKNPVGGANVAGLAIESVSNGSRTTDYGIILGGADTQTLWVDNGADSTSAARGICYGASRDTCLYRGGSSVLKTDANFQGFGGVATKGSTGLVVYETALVKNISMGHDGTNGLIAVSSGNLSLNSGGHITAEGVTSTGATGSGKFVFDGTPTLVTPVLGVATATSLSMNSGAVTMGANGWAYTGGNTTQNTYACQGNSLTTGRCYQSSSSNNTYTGTGIISSTYSGTGSGDVALFTSTNASSSGNALVVNQTGTGLAIKVTGHVASTGTVPTVANNDCGTTVQGTVNSGSTDLKGQLVVGTTTVTSCAMTFGLAYATAPTCVCMDATTSLIVRCTTSTTKLTVAAASTMSGDTINYICIQ